MMSLSTNNQNHSTLQLQHAINEFKKKQHDKTVIQNKLNILKQKCETNRRKTKNVHSQVNKINHIKSSYLQQKNTSKASKIQIQGQLAGQAEKQARKNIREKTLRQQSKQNMHIIRNLVQKEKKEEYFKIKEKARYNEMRISQNFKQSLHLKQQKSLEIKLQEQNSKLSRTISLEKKRLLAQSMTRFQLDPLRAGTERTDQYIEDMKRLQMQMTQNLRSSRQSLSSSKLTLKRNLK